MSWQRGVGTSAPTKHKFTPTKIKKIQYLETMASFSVRKWQIWTCGNPWPFVLTVWHTRLYEYSWGCYAMFQEIGILDDVTAKSRKLSPKSWKSEQVVVSSLYTYPGRVGLWPAILLTDDFKHSCLLLWIFPRRHPSIWGIVLLQSYPETIDEGYLR